MEVAGAFELAGVGERADVDRSHPAVLHKPAYRCLRVLVVGRDEDIERAPVDLAGGEGARERRVESLDDLRVWNLACDLLRDRASRDRQRLIGLGVDGVRDVDDDLAVQRLAVPAQDVVDRLVPDRQDDDVAG